MLCSFVLMTINLNVQKKKTTKNDLRKTETNEINETEEMQEE